MTTPPAGYGNPRPYQPPALGELAAWGTRVLAALIDIAILISAQLAIRPVSNRLAQLVVLAIEVFFAYLVGTKGQSPGKQIMKIKVVKDPGAELLGFGMALVRWLLHIVDGLSLGIGFLWPLWDPKKQTFADKLAGSVVVRTA